MVPTFVTSFPSILEISITSARNTKKATAKPAPFIISSTLKVPAIFTTTAIRIIAAENLSNIVLTLSIFLACSLSTSFPNASIIKVITPAIAAKPTNPCVHWSGSIEPMSFATIAIINIDTAIFFIILPTLSIFAACFSSTSFPNAATTNTIAPTIAAKPTNPCVHWSGSIEPIIFTVAAINKRATPTERRQVFMPLTFIPCLSIDIDDSDILLTPIANAANTNDNTVNAPTELHNLPVSN